MKFSPDVMNPLILSSLDAATGLPIGFLVFSKYLLISFKTSVKLLSVLRQTFSFCQILQVPELTFIQTHLI